MHRGMKLGLLAAGGIVFALLLGELVVRVFGRTGYVTPRILRERLLEYEPALFARHVFPRRAKRALGADGARYRVNTLGYRGPEFSVSKPPGTTRILFYGGSMVFDTYADGDQDWPSRTGALLRERGFPRVETVNAGIPGHASFDCVGRLLTEGHTFSPDYVVLCNAWNDIKTFRSDEPLLRQMKPLASRGDPRHHYRNGLDEWVCEHSQLYVRLRYRYYSRRLRLGSEGVEPEGEYTATLSPAALRQYELNLRLFADLAANIGAVPVFVTQPRLVSRANTEAERVRISYGYQRLTHEALCDAFEKTDEVVRRVAADKRALLIDAAQTMSGQAALFKDHVHLNAAGSAELARLAADALAAALGKGERPD